MNNKISIFDLELDEIKALFQEWGEAGYRSRQLWNALYQKLITDLGQSTNLPDSLKTRLLDHYSFENLTPVDFLESTDQQTSKVLLELPDGARIETVLMNYDDRHTLCISSQVGCAMNCSFCATGQMGFTRNLTAGEIVGQVLFFARILRESDQSVTNIVYMGMGEPFHNYDAVMKSFRILNHPDGFNLGARRFTISTVGLIPGIERFTTDNTQINLAISLHATDETQRSSIMPVNNRYPIKDLIAACHRYFDTTGRRITFEWALIQGVNDTNKEAVALANLLQDLTCHVNVIPLNPTKGYQGKKSPMESVNAFQKTLQQHGIPCTIRIRRGIDIQAGCGQLASKNN